MFVHDRGKVVEEEPRFFSGENYQNDRGLSAQFTEVSQYIEKGVSEGNFGKE